MTFRDWFTLAAVAVVFVFVAGVIAEMYWSTGKKERARHRKAKRRLRRMREAQRQRQRGAQQARQAELNRLAREERAKPEWEVKLEGEIDDLVLHARLLKRVREKYAVELQDKELAGTVNRLLERRRVEIVTGDMAG